ncbi:MAG: hypothetical protein N2323_06365 [candidate division WOR-3 bacterium]|nr:hypothetical protein [candidate division WOR-3 bacterium]MCX7837552.1 hypothetical protein [candidate division WOR-3 bacterium]MDW8114047.1 hypothetical protein [candidate division WOR-3 bacterium]
MQGLFKKALFLMPSQTKKFFTRINDDKDFIFYLFLSPKGVWELLCYKTTGERIWRATNLKEEDIFQLIGEVF